MEELRNYVEASLNLASAEDGLKQFLLEEIGLASHKIKSIQLDTFAIETKVKQVIVIEMSGKNSFASEDVASIKGLKIITPNTIEIEVGEFEL